MAHNGLTRMNYALRLVLITVSIICLLVSCIPSQEMRMQIGTNRWPGYETLYLARSLGAFENTPIRLVELSSATDVIHALEGGLLDAAALTLDEALGLIQTGTKLKVVLVMDFSMGADVLLARPGINHMQALKGRRVAVESNAAGALLLDAALDAANLSTNDIQIIPYTADEHIDAYKRGLVEAVVTFEPAKSHLLSIGAQLLFDSSRMPNKILDVLVVRNEVLEAQPETIKTLLRAQFLALDYLKSQPLSAAQRMAPRLELSPEALLDSYRGLRLLSLEENLRLLSGSQPKLQDTAEQWVALMHRKGFLTEKIDIKDLLDERAVMAVAL